MLILMLASMYISFVVRTDNTINMKIFPTEYNSNTTLYFVLFKKNNIYSWTIISIINVKVLD